VRASSILLRKGAVQGIAFRFEHVPADSIVFFREYVKLAGTPKTVDCLTPAQMLGITRPAILSLLTLPGRLHQQARSAVWEWAQFRRSGTIKDNWIEGAESQFAVGDCFPATRGGSSVW
jgi:hypothetical protein